MLTLSRKWGSRTLTDHLDTLTKDKFNYKHGFADFIRIRLLAPLNLYVHGDRRDEPDPETWYKEFLLPTIQLTESIVGTYAQIFVH